MKRINQNPAEQHAQNFMAATNAVAQQQQISGEDRNPEYLSAANASTVYQKMIKMAVAMSDPSNVRHNEVFNALQGTFGKRSDVIDTMSAIGERYLRDGREIANSFMKAGLGAEAAVEGAFNALAGVKNSIMGNPVYDHFVSLNLLAGQLYQEKTFVNAWLESGDAMAMQLEPGSTGLDVSRFRAPTEQVSGSSKVIQGDINPTDSLRNDFNRLSISLQNEFKNALTIGAGFSISQAQRDQALGYERAVNPAMAGFILQNRYFSASQESDLKLAELVMVGGLKASGSYIPGVGGSYGFLSSDIWLALASSGAVSPETASTSDWLSNPTKLIQKLENAIYKPADVTAQLNASVSPLLMYQEIVRAIGVLALQNIDFAPKEWAVFVPSSWYQFAVQYPSTGTFNKQLQEMITDATAGKIVGKINILPSSLMNYAAGIGNGQVNGYNYMVICAMGCRPEKKPIIMPGQTALPVITSSAVSPALMEFQSQYVTGGIMAMHYGGALVLEFSVAA